MILTSPLPRYVIYEQPQITFFQASPGKRLSERFLTRIGARLGERDRNERVRERPDRVLHRDIHRSRGFDSRRLGKKI